MFEVDVFEHPRFWDEFSHLVNGRFVATPDHCRCLISAKSTFETCLKSCCIVSSVISYSITFSFR